MRLTVKQKGALVRLLNFPWRAPWRNAAKASRGILQQGWRKTCGSLERKGLIRYVRAGEYTRKGTILTVNDEGYELTEEGEKIASELSAAANPRVVREATRAS
jgi:hypothetical protein